MAEIGISLSGGGYRAAMFHLGTLSYLNHLDLIVDKKKPNEKHMRFLDLVTSMSTISGGTITGLWYMMYCNQKKDKKGNKKNATDQSFLKLYKILTEEDFPTEILDAFLEKGNRNPSLIKEAVKVYDKLFFHGETFKKILDDVQDTYIHHFSANGTDFSNGLAYRFYAVRKMENSNSGYHYTTIGNFFHPLPGKIASQIKLSEILAVSSCFPGGFEPMHFPADFAFSADPKNKEFVEKTERYRLMDGGIVDNQGIEPLLLAEKHLALDKRASNKDLKQKSIDLLIISDVSSPFMKPDNQEATRFYSNITLNSVNKWLSVAVLFLVLLWIPAYYFASHFVLGILTALLVLTIISRGITHTINAVIRRKLRRVPILYHWKNIRHLTLGRLNTMILDRLDSLLDLSQTVFMRPIRTMRYQQVYDDDEWKNRRIATNISELSRNGIWMKCMHMLKEIEQLEKDSQKLQKDAKEFLKESIASDDTLSTSENKNKDDDLELEMDIQGLQEDVKGLQVEVEHFKKEGKGLKLSLDDLKKEIKEFQRNIKRLQDNKKLLEERMPAKEILENFDESGDDTLKGNDKEIRNFKKIIENSDLAASMGTTLWFTAEDKAKGLPEAVFAAGQYTICMNLLDYIYKLKRNSSNTNETHELIKEYETLLKDDLEKFKDEPKFLLNEFIGREDKTAS